ncbi:ribosome-recycling factor [Candidatus Parcubacteria bacterium]|nr:MAG: ribosome-recycling factor [Candidatus Parcubacteria bacterium]
MTEETHLKELESGLRTLTDRFKQDIQMIRGNRPSVDLIESIKVSLYDQSLAINQLGSLSVVPPRGINITVWDKNAVGAVAKAVENAKVGLSVSTDGNTIRASLSPLGEERREELIKLTGKTAEGARIQVRHTRDEAIKKIKAAGESRELTEDQVFKLKEKIQKAVDKANSDIEVLVDQKLNELGE